MPNAIGPVGDVSTLQAMEQGTEAEIANLQSMIDGAGATAPKGAQGGLQANLGAACKLCPGGHKPPTAADLAQGKGTDEAGKLALLQSLGPLLDAAKQLLASLKAQEAGLSANPSAQALSQSM